MAWYLQNSLPFARSHNLTVAVSSVTFKGPSSDEGKMVIQGCNSLRLCPSQPGSWACSQLGVLCLEA